MKLRLTEPKGKTTQEWAVLFLLFAGGGFALSFPWRDTLLGGLLTSGCGAALFGGLTDWFAVVSLFRKPWGIPFLRAVIPSKKDKIIDSLANMVEKDLLAYENIEKIMHRHNLMVSFSEMVHRPAAHHIIRKFLQQITIDVLETEHIDAKVAVVRKVILAMLSQQRAGSILSTMEQIARWTETKGYLDKVYLFLLAELKRLLQEPAFQESVHKAIATALAAYKNKGGSGRRLVLFVVEILTTPHGGFNLYLLDKLFQLLNTHRDDHNLRQAMRHRLLSYMATLAHNPVVSEYIGATITRIEKDPQSLDEYIRSFIVEFETGLKADQGTGKVYLNFITAGCYDLLTGLDQETQKQVDEFLKSKILELIAGNRHMIGDLVRTRLRAYPPGELERLIERKVGKDLQVIRLTGTAIGFVAGIFVFAMNHIIMVMIR